MCLIHGPPTFLLPDVMQRGHAEVVKVLMDAGTDADKTT